MNIFSAIVEILATPAVLLGVFTCIGLLTQKKDAGTVVKGTATAIVGFIILTAGSDFLQHGALLDFGTLFRFVFQIRGVIPNMEAVSSLGIAEYAWETSLIMALGMIVNLILAKFGPFPYIFLTGHHSLYMACLLAIVLHEEGLTGWTLVIAGALFLGFLMVLSPAVCAHEVKKITGGEKIALGHFSAAGYLLAAYTARLTGRGRAGRSTEELHFPKSLSFMRDTTVSLFLVMGVMFLLLTGMAAGRPGFSELDTAYKTGAYRNWVLYAIVMAAEFSAGIYIVLAGVRLVIAEIVPAFRGIAKTLVPHARPAVDCPILFNYAPNAVMIGFLMSFLGGVAVMAALMILGRYMGSGTAYVIVPGVVAHFFCGGTAGVFANAEGGLKGCLIGSFIHGIALSLLSLLAMPVLRAVSLTGTTFSDADYCVVGIVLSLLRRIVPGGGILIGAVLCVVIPILFKQFMDRRG